MYTYVVHDIMLYLPARHRSIEQLAAAGIVTYDSTSQVITPLPEAHIMTRYTVCTHLLLHNSTYLSNMHMYGVYTGTWLQPVRWKEL